MESGFLLSQRLKKIYHNMKMKHFMTIQCLYHHSESIILWEGGTITRKGQRNKATVFQDIFSRLCWKHTWQGCGSPFWVTPVCFQFSSMTKWEKTYVLCREESWHGVGCLHPWYSVYAKNKRKLVEGTWQWVGVESKLHSYIICPEQYDARGRF